MTEKLITENSKSANKNSEGTTDKKGVVRYDHNPFVENMVVPVRGKNVRLSTLGKDGEINVANTESGEHFGTHITATKRVDEEQFVKLFTQNVGLTFGLKSAGIKALSVLIWIVQRKGIDKDLVPLDKLVLDDFIADHGDRKPPLKLSQPTFWRGLAELEEAQIIAKHLRQGWYYTNPNFIFNGNRLAFTTILERKTKEEEARDKAKENQQSLPFGEGA